MIGRRFEIGSELSSRREFGGDQPEGTPPDEAGSSLRSDEVAA